MELYDKLLAPLAQLSKGLLGDLVDQEVSPSPTYQQSPTRDLLGPPKHEGESHVPPRREDSERQL